MSVLLLRLLGCGAFLLWMAAATAAPDRPTRPFSRDWLIAHAEERAAGDYEPRLIAAGSPLGKLDYDRYRAIEFRRGASIWSHEGRNFTVDLLPPGFIYRTPVEINLVVNGISRRVLYTTDVFKYGLDTAPIKDVAAPGYSGFRVATPINRPDLWDEFLVFQGASYFRAVGADERYGLSARGLAIATAEPSGEEFPVFTEFWIERPRADAEQIVIHALLESRSITGAYTFTATPGNPTTVDVDSVLFPRADLSAYGIAPLTSMFLFDATDHTRFDDFRTAVHDSDGLEVTLGNGEHLWRPLANPLALQVSSFAGEGLKGFGLMQRHRQFEDYGDSEARYDLRPSVWIEPRGTWGSGHVELVEIPTDEEVHDNIVAFWQPEAALRAGGRYEFAYRMYWGNGASAPVAPVQIVGTRAGGDVRTNRRTFVIDFAPAAIPDDLEVSATASDGTIVTARGFVVEATGQYRVTITLDPEGADLAELRMVVSSGGQPWGETWLYRWTR